MSTPVPQRKKPFLPPSVWVSALLSTLIYWFTRDLPFFWDTIQLSARQATHFYEGGGWLLPDEIDSGHPPAFGAYLAMWWSVLGRSLWVSHLAMLPWTFLFINQVLRLNMQHLGPMALLGLLACLLDPVIIGQLLLVSPDVILLTAFLIGFRYIQVYEDTNSWKFYAAILLLALISTRGWMAAFALYLLHVSQWVIAYARDELDEDELPKGKPSVPVFILQTLFRKLPPYLPGAVIALAYLFFHYQAKGWVSFHPDSPWAASFEQQSTIGILRNMGLVGWRLIDGGRIIGWLLLAYAMYQHGYKRLVASPPYRGVVLGIILFLIVIVPMVVMRSGLTAPRYFLPAIFLLVFLVAYSLLHHHDQVKRQEDGSYLIPVVKKWQYYGYALFCVALLAGNFLIYPHRIAQAWDATPAHLPFYQQEANAIKFLDREDIALDKVGSVFPSVGPRDWRSLNGRSDGFKQAEASTDNYLFVSIIHNDWPDSTLDVLTNVEAMPSNNKSEWRIIWREKSRLGIWSIIYARDQ